MTGEWSQFQQIRIHRCHGQKLADMTFASPSVLPAAGALTKERVMALVTRPSPLVRTGTDTGRAVDKLRAVLDEIEAGDG